MSDTPELNWSAASVQDGTLTVELTGDTDDDWGQTFSRTLALLSSSGSWGAVAFDDGTVTVKQVQEGSEDSVRFALDAAVQEANAHHTEDDDPDGDADQGADTPDGDDDEPDGDDADRRMTDRFRDSG
jgi:hypothetical protein